MALIALGVLAAGVAVGAASLPPITETGSVTRGAVYAALGVGAVACAEVGLVAVWHLLSRVRRDVIFDEGAFRWVDAISVAGLLLCALVAAVCVHVGHVDDSPGLGGVGLGIGVVGVAFVLLMSVMRGLLRNATRLRRELDQVV